jgi:photosystem II stability/assembly factor-like uncharacterized protein
MRTRTPFTRARPVLENSVTIFSVLLPSFPRLTAIRRRWYLGVLIVAVLSCLGAEPRFERLGPFGGTVRALLISAKNSKIVYLGTNDGQLYKSLDSGDTWGLLAPGLGRRQFVVEFIVEDPAIPDRVFAGGWDLRSSGGGLFESRDAGRSWTQLRVPKLEVAVRSFAVSRRNPAFMIVGTGSGIFVSADGGRTWQPRGAGNEAFLQTDSVAIDPDDPRFLFVGTWHLGFRSSDFGKTWVQNDKGMIFDSDIFSIAIDSRNPKNVYASACTGLYRSIDHGVSWSRLRVFPKSYLVRAQLVSIDPIDSNRVYGGTTEGLFLSRDAGRNWTRVTPADWTVNAIQVDPADGKTVLIGTDLHGVMRSVDGGLHWSATNSGFVNRSIAGIVPDRASPGKVWVGEFFEGKVGGWYAYDSLVRAWDPAISAEGSGEGLLALQILPGNHGRIAGTARGAFMQKPEGGSWTSIPGSIAKLNVYSFTVDLKNGWVFAGTNDGVYRARIDAPVFQKPSGYRVIPRVYCLLGPLQTAGAIFAGTQMGVLRSDDSGLTWNFASDGLPNGATVECLVSFPGAEDRLMAGTSSGLYQSRNAGRTWEGFSDSRLGGDIPAVLFPDRTGKRILAADGSNGGVYVSEDEGRTWSKLEDPEFGSPVRSMAQDPDHPAIIYLGTRTEGLYRLILNAR